jgi:hypothetical protein
MITDVFATWMWANGSFTYSYTVYPGNRNIAAYIALSKIDGNSKARAYIGEYCYQQSSDQVFCAVSGGDGDSVQNFIPNALSVTFELLVDNTFAYAPILIFFHN